MKKQNAKSPAWRQWLRRGILIGLVITAGSLLWTQLKRDQFVHPPEVSLAPLQPSDERGAREAAYDKDVAALENLLQSGAADEQTREQAARRLENMIAEHQSELAIEEALVQAGFQPVLVLCQNGAVTVMVKENLSTEAGASVLGLCMAHADVGAQNIRIMTAQP